MATKIAEIPEKSVCAAWCPVKSGVVALGSKVSISCVEKEGCVVGFV